MSNITHITGLVAMNLQKLYEECVEEIATFVRQRLETTTKCFELMRQALYQDDSDAFGYLYNAYAFLVRHWVSIHPAFYNSGETADFFVSGAFSNFYFANRGDKFLKLETLSGALAYLKACVHTAILQHVRRQNFSVPLDLVVSLSTKQHMDKNLLQMEVWERIEYLLAEPDERLLTYLRFSQGMKPSEIADAFAEKWSTARDVSVALQKIKRTLSKDQKLRNLLYDATLDVN